MQDGYWLCFLFNAMLSAALLSWSCCFACCRCPVYIWLHRLTVRATTVTTTAAGASLPMPEVGEAGWVGMRTVADLRRALGVGAPRDRDSLYLPIERAPRKFNPLKIPRALQACCVTCASRASVRL